jgi:hypothetical protein
VKGAEDQCVTTDISTLLTALYVKIDDWLGRPPRIGRPPEFFDAEGDPGPLLPVAGRAIDQAISSP